MARHSDREEAMSEYIRIEKPRPHHISVITMNRPDRLNSMSFDLMLPLHEAFETVAEDNNSHCVVLTGTGEGF